MANRLKEDEKNERIIRGLLKLPENRRCINCNSLGPQYVCTNFWTFVCTNCSGIHREFTHRVKSISMAKFTSQEVSALQEGGNQRAKEIYFKEWDPQRQSFPDSSNVDRLRDFIKHVYVDRKFTGERTYDKPPRGKGERDDFYENRRFDTYQGGSKSPPYEDTYERRYSDRSSSGGRSYDERRSPGYDQESRQYGDNKRSPGRPPVINDWRREDRFGDRRMSDGDNKLEGQSPERTKDLGPSSPPVVRPVREILGENVVPLRISEPPRANTGRAADGATLTQRTASSSSLASSNGNPAEVKLETTKSLIDFDTEPEPPSAPAISQAAQTAVVQSVVQPANSSDDNNWASFDIAPATQVAQAAQGPSNVNPLESVLSQLSVPTSVPAPSLGAQGGPDVATALFRGNISTLPKTGDSSVLPAGHMAASTLAAKPAGDATIGSFSAFPNTSMSVASPALTTVSPLNDAGQWPNLQHQQPLFPAAVSQSTTQQTTTPAGGALNSQPWNLPPAPTIQGHPSTSMLHAPHLVAKPANDANPGISTQPSSAEVKPTGRKELPEDLFTLKYPSFPAPIPAWQMGAQHGMGYPVQYNTMVPMPSFPQSSKSINPFDVGNERPPVQAPTFPSMSSLQGALPSVSPPGVMLPSSLGNPSLSWMPPQSSSYGTVLPQQTQTLPSAMAPRPFMGQRMPTSIPMQRPQETGSLSAEGAALGFSSSVSANPYSVGGNPFG